MALSPDSSKIAYAISAQFSEPAALGLGDIASGDDLFVAPYERVIAKSHFVSTIAFSSSGALLAAGDSESVVRVFDAKRGSQALGKEVARIEVPNDPVFFGISWLAFSPTEKTIFARTYASKLTAWNILDGKQRLSVADVHEAAMSGDQRFLTYISANKLHVLDSTDLSEWRIANAPTDINLLRHFSKAQNLLLTRDRNDTYVMWRVRVE